MIGWVLYADVVAELVKEHGISEREASRQIVTAARHGILITQGRLHQALGQPFVIAPAAWLGMDADPVLSMLCTPNPGLEVQEPFLKSPDVFMVEIDAISLDAWVAGKPIPAAPQPVPDALRNSPLAWLDYPTKTAEGSQRVDGKSPQAEVVNGEAQPVKKRGGRPPSIDADLLKDMLQAEVKKQGGWPELDGVHGWRQAGDMDEFLIQCCRSRKWQVADETVINYRRAIVKKLEAEGVGQN